MAGETGSEFWAAYNSRNKGESTPKGTILKAKTPASRRTVKAYSPDKESY